MKLTEYQNKLFSSVSVDWRRSSSIPTYKNLKKIYNSGWWITKMFGSYAVFVKPHKWTQNGFCCTLRKVFITENYTEIEKEIQSIAQEKLEKYRDYLNL